MAEELKASYAGLERKVEERTAELTDALQRQTATAEILRVIAGSPADVQPVLDAIVLSAARLFPRCSANIVMLEDGWFQLRAGAYGHLGATGSDGIRSPGAVYPLAFDPVRSPSARAIAERRIIEIEDTEAPGTPEFTKAAAAASGFRSAAFVPLMREGAGIGVLILTSRTPGLALEGEHRTLALSPVPRNQRLRRRADRTDERPLGPLGAADCGGLRSP